jgi:putative NADPH-quinone reductase
MLEQDLALYAAGRSTDPLVQEYQNILMETDELVLIFPIWWYNIPAILKGFMDKVMLKDFAYVETKSGLKGRLTHIKKTSVFTTSETPTLYMNLFKGNPIHGVFIRGTLKGVVLHNIKWCNCGFITRSSRSKRERYLRRIARIISSQNE